MPTKIAALPARSSPLDKYFDKANWQPLAEMSPLIADAEPQLIRTSSPFDLRAPYTLLKVHKVTAHLGMEYDFNPMLTGIAIRRRMFRAEEAVLLKQFLGGSIV